MMQTSVRCAANIHYTRLQLLQDLPHFVSACMLDLPEPLPICTPLFLQALPQIPTPDTGAGCARPSGGMHASQVAYFQTPMPIPSHLDACMHWFPLNPTTHSPTHPRGHWVREIPMRPSPLPRQASFHSLVSVRLVPVSEQDSFRLSSPRHPNPSCAGTVCARPTGDTCVV